MSIKPRNRRPLRKKLLAYVFLLILFILLGFCINLFFISKNSQFISPLGKNNLDSINLEKILREKDILFSTVTISGSSYAINIPNNGQVKFSQEKDIAKQVSSLQRILKELTIEGKPFKSIDFRFNEPIIIFE